MQKRANVSGFLNILLPGKGVRWYLAGVLLITFAVYAPSLDNGFLHWDDDVYIADNSLYRGFTAESLGWMFSTRYGGLYQPLSWLSYALDHALWGLNPFGFHLTNLLLHTLAAGLFFLLARELFILHGAGKTHPSRVPWAAAFAALVWAIHPLRVESVVWATERRDVLSGAFFIGALLFYVRGRNAPAVGSYVLSLFSKGMGVTLPVVLVLLDVYPLKKLPGSPMRWLDAKYRKVWKEKLLFAIAAGAVGAIGVLGQYGAGTVNFLGIERSAFDVAAQIGGSLLFYLRATVWPSGLIPLYEPSPESVSAAVFAFRWMVIAGGAGAFFLLVRRRPYWPAAAAFYVVTLIPVAGFVQYGPQMWADRYSYIACLSWSLLAGGVFFIPRASGEGKKQLRVLAASGVLLLSASAAAAVRQAEYWKSDVSLWTRQVSIAPESVIGRINLASAYMNEKRFDAAESAYKEALSRSPGNFIANMGVGQALRLKERHKEAAGYFRAALKYAPNNVEAHLALGYALAHSGEPGEGAAHLERAVSLDPRRAGQSYDAGVLYLKAGRRDKAEAAFRRALELAPGFEPARRGLRLLQSKTKP